VFENLAAPANASVAFVAAPDFTGKVCGLRASGAAPAPNPALSKSSRRERPQRGNASAGSAACAANPGKGVNLSLRACSAAATPLSASVWTWARVAGEAGVLQLASDPALCAAQVGTNPDTGTPNLALGACAPADRLQHFLPFPANGNALLNPVTGRCMDADGGSAGAGARVETYGCDGGGNQGWVFTAAQGGVKLVVQNGAQLCLAAC
jgi:hypothetical protein